MMVKPMNIQQYITKKFIGHTLEKLCFLQQLTSKGELSLQTIQLALARALVRQNNPYLPL